jgi:AcrR family transcriptional regulator
MRKSVAAELGRRRPSGRRTGTSGTRDAVLAAARRQFAEIGYDRASLRSIAAEARVDQKLVAYFFGSKHALFVTATHLPFDAGAMIAHVLAGAPAEHGNRLAHRLVEMLDNPEAGPRLIGLVRAAAAEPEAARLLRDLLGREIWSPAAAAMDVGDSALVVTQVATQVLGLVMTRYVIRLEPLASMSGEAVVDLVAPTLQRLFDGATQGGNHGLS